MISSFFKYGVIIFWGMLLALNTIIFKIPGNFVYIFLGIALLLSSIVLYKFPKIVLHKAFLPLSTIILINLLYWIFIDHSTNSFLYIAAKASTFFIIMISVYFYYDFLIKNFPKAIIYVGIFVLVIGIVLNTNYFGGRYSGPFGNPNSLGWLSSLVFGLVYLSHEKSYKKYFILLFLLALVMMSGSRAALGGVVLAILLRGTFSFKKVFFIAIGLMALLAAQNIASKFGIHTGLERIIKSEKSNELLSGREKEYALGLLTIKESPMLGNGLDKYAWISPKIIRESGLRRIDPNFVGNPHNSFIAMFIMYGIPIGFLVLVTTLIPFLGFFKKEIPKDILFMVLFSFIAAFFESYLFGVSGFEGLVFWTSLALAAMSVSKEKAIECKISKVY